MGELRDYDLGSTSAPPPPPTGPNWAYVVVAILVLVLVGLGIFSWYSRRPRHAQQTATPPVQQPAERPRAPLGGPGENIEVPPLGETDPLVRLLVGRLSTHPAVAAWLASDGLIRNATVTVQNVAAGQTPSRHLRRMGPQGSFSVRENAGDIITHETIARLVGHDL